MMKILNNVIVKTVIKSKMSERKVMVIVSRSKNMMSSVNWTDFQRPTYSLILATHRT